MKPFKFFQNKKTYEVEYPPNFRHKPFVVQYAYHCGWYDYFKTEGESYHIPFMEQRLRNVWFSGYCAAKNKVTNERV